MKSGTFALSAISLLQLVVAQPYGHQRFHKRSEIATDYTTVTTPEVVVWVYENGETATIETRTPGIAAATPAPQKVELEESAAAEPTPTPDSSASSGEVEEEEESAPAPSPLEAYAKSAPVSEEAPPPTEAPAPPPASYPESEPEAKAVSSPSSGLGICYSPYNSDGTCKDGPAVSADLSTIAKAGYSIIRIYGVDCNQVSNVLSAASTSNLQVFAGLLTISDVAGDLASLLKQAKGDLSRISTISIGNELVDMGKASVSDVVGALGTAHDILGSAGFSGSIVTVDTFNALIAHPELCRASDYCAANAHSYFDGTIEPSGAGAWVRKQVGRIGDAAGGGKRVVITESGWPHAGGGNGVAVPSPENQAKAVESIRGAFGDGLFLFSAFDDKWKQDGAWGVEKNWGIM